MGIPHLVVQPAQDMPPRAGMIILNEVVNNAGLDGEAALVEALEEEAAAVAINFRLQQQNPRQGCATDLHPNTRSVSKLQR
ncbi:hypothetical protein SDC9_195739 [bioreactor metagenome]|uniref:Uncharacterized protein n=1 Tax=bioreactor metagenome TaxID=1076179 RepID=A0A645IIJ3_9ZZZZ